MSANNYHVDNTTVQFSFCLNSLPPFVVRQFRKHFLYAKGFMLKLLQKQNSTIGAKEISDLLAHLHTPIIYAYVLFIGILVSILAIPFIYCATCCIKKRIDIAKYQCCFPIEIMLFVLFAVCWVVGTVGAYQITIQIQDGLMIFPAMWRNAIKDLLTNTDIFKTEVRSLVNKIENSSALITNKTMSIPECLTGLYKLKLNPNMEEAILRINGNTLVAEVVFSTSRFVFNNTADEHSVEVLINGLNQKIGNIYRLLDYLQEKTSKNYNLYSTNKFKLFHAFEPFQFREWKIIHDNLQILFNNLLPAANKSLFFLDDLQLKLKYYTRTELSRVTSATRNLQELSLEVERNITEAIKELLPLKFQENIINNTNKIDNFLSSLSLSRNYHNMRFVNGSLWIMLMPTIYAFLGCIILMVAFYTASDDLKNIFMNVAWTPCARFTTYTFTMFRISMKYSVTFLWFLFILTAVFYCLYLPLSVFCTAATDQEIFTKYVDNPKVWNNKTWLGYKWQNYLPKYGHLLKTRNFLNNCYYNQSIYNSLNMQEFWNVSQHIDALNMNINMDVLQTKVAKAVGEVELPDEAMLKLIKKLEIIEHNFDLHLLRPIRRHIVNFQFYIEDIFAKTVNDTNNIYNMQIQELLHDVKLQISYISRESTDLERFHNYLKGLWKETLTLNDLMGNFPRIINETSNSTVPSYVNTTCSNINSLIMEMRTEILTGVETIGNCYVLPYVRDKITWSVCGYGLSLITGAWITLGLISTSMFFCIIFSCRTCGYIRGSQSNYYKWMQHVRNNRDSTDAIKLTGSLMFDRSGNFIGHSIKVKEPTEEKAV